RWAVRLRALIRLAFLATWCASAQDEHGRHAEGGGRPRAVRPPLRLALRPRPRKPPGRPRKLLQPRQGAIHGSRRIRRPAAAVACAHPHPRSFRVARSFRVPAAETPRHSGTRPHRHSGTTGPFRLYSASLYNISASYASQAPRARNAIGHRHTGSSGRRTPVVPAVRPETRPIDWSAAPMKFTIDDLRPVLIKGRVFLTGPGVKSVNDTGSSYQASQLVDVQRDIVLAPYTTFSDPAGTSLVCMGAFSYSISKLPHDIRVGRYTAIGRRLKVMGTPLPAHCASVSPTFYDQKAMINTYQEDRGAEVKARKFAPERGRISIGNDVWIGADVTLGHGVCIGDGA